MRSASTSSTSRTRGGSSTIRRSCGRPSGSSPRSPWRARTAARARTGLPLAFYFSASKIRWILDEVPEARALSAAGRLRVGTVDSWLVWNLTGGVHGGVHVTDVTNASRTLLMDLETGRWSAPMLELFGLDPEEWEAMAPRIVPSVGVLGEVTGHETLAGVPVAGVLGDQQAACFGQALFGPGDTKNTYGTGCFLLQHTGTQRPTSAHGLVSTVAYQRAGEPMRYALEGSVAVAGALVQWLRDGLGIISTSEEVEAAAATVPDNGGVVIVPAFAGLLQFQADILDLPVVRPAVAETTVMGAAWAAGLAVGVWPDEAALCSLWREDRRWEPAMAASVRERLLDRWRRAVEASLGWA